MLSYQPAHSKQGVRISKVTTKEMANSAVFFALPRELRDRVYDYCFLGEGGILIRFRQDKLQVIATYGIIIRYHFNWTQTRNITKAGLSPWLLANKQVFVEALEQFHHKAKFMCIDNFPFRLSQDLVTSGQLSLHRARIVDLQEHISPLMNVWEEYDSDGAREYVFGYQLHVEKLYGQIMHNLLNPWSALRILTLGFFINKELTLPDSDVVPYRFHDKVGFISKLSKSLMKVTFVLRIHFSDILSGSIWHKVFKYVPMAFQKELKHIALLLVDDEETICVEKKEFGRYRKGFRTVTDYCWSLEVTTASYRRGFRLEKI